MTKYIIEYVFDNNLEVAFETSERDQAFSRAWELKNKDDIISVKIKEIHTYNFKGEYRRKA